MPNKNQSALHIWCSSKKSRTEQLWKAQLKWKNDADSKSHDREHMVGICTSSGTADADTTPKYAIFPWI